MTTLRILVAGIAESNDRIAAALHECKLTFVSTMAEAETALSVQYDVIMVAVRFDESRMFDLLRHLRAHPRLSHIPLICYRTAPGPVTATELALRAVEIATRTLGADEFIDLLSYPNKVSADLHLRNTVFRLAGVDHNGKSGC